MSPRRCAVGEVMQETAVTMTNATNSPGDSCARPAIAIALTLLPAFSFGCGAREGLGLPEEPGAVGPVIYIDAAGAGTNPDGPHPVPDASGATGPTADDSGVPGDASDGAPPAGGAGTLPPPWEFDGGEDPDAGCAGQTLASGACLQTLATGQENISAIAIDPDDVYWTSGGLGTGAIAKVSRSGGTPVTIATGLDDAAGLTVDTDNVYVDGRAIIAVAKNGGGPRTLFDDYNSDTSFIVRAGPRVYWADSDFNFGVRSCFTDGSGLEFLVGPSTPIAGIATTPNGIVFSETSDEEGVPSQLVSATADGTLATIVRADAFGVVKSASDVVVYTDGLHGMYWVPLEGGSPGLLTTDSYPTDIVTDGTFVYWTDANLRALMKLPIAAGAPEVLVSSFDSPLIGGDGYLTIDATSVYFTDAGTVFKLTPR